MRGKVPSGRIIALCLYIRGALASKVLTGEPGWWYALHVAQAVPSTTINASNTTTTSTTTSTSPPSNAVHLRKDAGCTTVRLEGRGAATDGSHNGWCRIVIDEKTIAENGAGCGNGLCFVVLNRFRRVPRASFCSDTGDSSYARFVALKLQALTPGTVVLAVLWKQGASTLIPELRKAIYDLGGLEGYRIENQEGYALIGIAGSGDGGAYAEDRAQDANISAVAQTRCIPHAPEFRRRRGTSTSPSLALSTGAGTMATAAQAPTTSTALTSAAVAANSTTGTTTVTTMLTSSTASASSASSSTSLNPTSADVLAGNATMTTTTSGNAANQTTYSNLTLNASQVPTTSPQPSHSYATLTRLAMVSSTTSASNQTTAVAEGSTTTTTLMHNMTSGAVSIKSVQSVVPVSSQSKSVSTQLVDGAGHSDAETIEDSGSSDEDPSDAFEGDGSHDEEIPDDPALDDLPPIQAEDSSLSAVATEPTLVRRALVSSGAEVTEDAETPDLPPIIRSQVPPSATLAVAAPRVQGHLPRAARGPNPQATSARSL